MFGRNNPATRHGVVVNVIDFLLHHLICIDLLRMNTFLPDLMLLEFFVGCAEISELIDQPVAFFRFNLGEERMGGESLEMAQGHRQLGTGKYGVKMVF